MKKIKLSIILVIHNNEKTIANCITNILKQTYQNIELILINDASQDDSLNTIKDYLYDEKIKLINHKIYEGIASSRNEALQVATGDYITFVNPYDIINHNYYKLLIDSIISKNADIAISNLIINNPHKNAINYVYYSCSNKKNIINTRSGSCLLNKVFKASLINNYKFTENDEAEAISFVIPAIINAKKLSCVANAYYNQTKHQIKIRSILYIFEEVDKTLNIINNNFEYKDIIIFNYLILNLFEIIASEKSIFKRHNALQTINKLIPKYNIKSNKYYQDYLNSSKNDNQKYYYKIFDLILSNQLSLANIKITFHDLKFKEKTIITNAKIEDIKVAAIYNCHLKDQKDKISVIVPNYNNGEFINQRIYSILCQDYKISELIILDDCSNDNSREVIDKIAKSITNQVKVITLYNDKHSNSKYKQWQKGLSLAHYKYVWLANVTDYCTDYFLKNSFKAIHNNADISISYVNTSFIDINGYIKSSFDIHSNKSYINDGMKEINDYFYLKNYIATISSCIIKKADYNEYLKLSDEYKEIGDWLFYVNVMSCGKINYVNSNLCYKRDLNYSSNNLEKVIEQEKLYKYFIKQFNLDSYHIKQMEENINSLKVFLKDSHIKKALK